MHIHAYTFIYLSTQQEYTQGMHFNLAPFISIYIALSIRQSQEVAEEDLNSTNFKLNNFFQPFIDIQSELLPFKCQYRTS